jgi:hypothetical protein
MSPGWTLRLEAECFQRGREQTESRILVQSEIVFADGSISLESLCIVGPVVESRSNAGIWKV